MITAADKEIRRDIDEKKSFLLDAGAGSGKTTSLVEALLYLIETNKAVDLAINSQRVACITFTNVAKDTIIERTASSPLFHVLTIHDFLWNVIKSHQKALKRALLQHNRVLKDDSSRKRDESQLEAALKNVTVNYSDRGPKFLEGRIFHDDLLSVALLIFAENPLMSRIVAARYPYIFVDEYQDTSAAVVSILVDHVLKANTGKVVIGFFGDKLQSIYHSGPHSGIGEIPADQRTRLKPIFKKENYRCSEAVIALLNHIRTDIQQYAAGENKNVEGAAVCIRLPKQGGGDDVLSRARSFVQEKLGWDLTQGTQKELFLTHKLIAKKVGYERLLDIYDRRGGFYRDQLLSGQDSIIKFLRDHIELLLVAWRGGQVGKVLSILRKGGFKLNENKDKARAKEALNKLADMQAEATIGDMLAHVDETGLLVLLDDLKKWIDIRKKGEAHNDTEDEKKKAEREFYLELLKTPSAQASAFFRYLEEHAPFSTKHGVKGDEFDTVFVVLDDKGARWWSQYSFDNYLSGEDESAGKKERARKTRNLFYVCCSRAVKNLAVIDLGDSIKGKDERLKEFFGTKNCFF